MMIYYHQTNFLDISKMLMLAEERIMRKLFLSWKK